MSKIGYQECRKAAQSAQKAAHSKLMSALGMIAEDAPDDAIFLIEEATEHLRDWMEADRVYRLLMTDREVRDAKISI